MGMKPQVTINVPPNIWTVFKVGARIRPELAKPRMTIVIPTRKSNAADDKVVFISNFFDFLQKLAPARK